MEKRTKERNVTPGTPLSGAEGGRQEEAGRGPMVRRPITGQERAEIMRARSVRNCHNCIFCVSHLVLWARTLLSGFPMTGQCANHPETAGRMRPVPGTPCRNFQMKSRPNGVTPPVPPGPECRYITLTRDLHALVDAQDYEWLKDYKWHATRDRGPGSIYASRWEKGHAVPMHRQIMDPPQGMVVDHKNGNGLDNRRCNLRICPQGDNARHSRKRRNGRSRFIGVSPVGNKWCAKVAGEHLGTFDDEVEAAQVRDRRAREVYGEFAWLNFPPEDPPEEGCRR